MRAKRSWRQLIFGLLGITFALLVVFLMVVNIHFFKQARETVRQSNTQILNIRGREVVTRLNAVREHVLEMVWTVNEKTDLKTGDQMQQYSARQLCLDIMENKINASEDVDYMYILDTDKNFLLLAASSDQAGSQEVKVTQYLKTSELETTSFRDESWSILNIGKTVYYAKAYHLGSFVIGVLSGVSGYDETLTGEISGTNTGYMLVKDGTLLYSGGYDWSPQLLYTGNLYILESKEITTAQYSFELSGADIILVTEENSLQSMLTSTTVTLTVVSVLFLLLLAVLLVMMTKLVSRPTQQLLTATRKIESGELSYRITELAASSEFALLCSSFNDMAEQIVHLKITEYEQQLNEKRNELKLLRAQIRPHFFLNAITTVLSMTYQDRDEDIRKYLTALSGFMRYMLQINSRTVKVGDELVNVRNYMDMQKISFPDSIAVFIGCEAGIESVQVPYLLLFTVVENTLKHAMSLYSTLSILIQCEVVNSGDFQGIRMIVEDNGDGFPEDVIARYGTGRDIQELEGHIGLSNIYRTLKLFYGRDDLLRISNAAPRGAHVELWIPRQEEDGNENADS